jgi:Flp pilus assembly pilin Flp
MVVTRISVRIMQRFAADTSGATAVEYAVMTFIAIAIVAAISALGGSVTGLYNQVAALFAN